MEASQPAEMVGNRAGSVAVEKILLCWPLWLRSGPGRSISGGRNQDCKGAVPEEQKIDLNDIRLRLRQHRIDLSPSSFNLTVR
jgi:hypothetical protein